ncbi:MAG TPA: hypothetical protein VFC82_02470 [Actinomycetaceae bacterium]|nr:hypothetical protein [Actinomycetaceae bacterium]
MSALLATAGCGGNGETEEPTTVAAGTEASTEAAAETESVPSGDGTREAPFSPGSTASIGDYEVSLGSAILNANEMVAQENQFNDPPAEGRQFVLVPVTATYTGDESGTAWVDLSIQFVGAGGNTFGDGMDDHCGVIPNSLTDQGEMYGGATVEGNACVSVPSDQVEGGTWVLEDPYDFDDTKVFFAIQ